MIDGLVQIFIWQGIGELVSRFLFPSLPGPVVGLVLLVAYLTFKGEVNPSLGMVADSFRQHLALLFVPASVGVVLYLPDLKANAFAVTVSLVVSVIIAIAVTALVLKTFSPKEPTFEDEATYKLAMKDFEGKDKRKIKDRRADDRRSDTRRSMNHAAEAKKEINDA